MRAWLLSILVAGSLACLGYFTFPYWYQPFKARFASPGMETDEVETKAASLKAGPPQIVKLSKQARKNIALQSRPAKLQTYIRTIEIPGMIVDLPGRSDRGVTSPAVGIVTGVHSFPGDTVSPGDRLFTLRLFSEYLQSAQKGLFNASRELQLINEQIARLSQLVDDGGVARSKLIEFENERSRQDAIIQGHRQDLLTRGLTPDQVDAISRGEFVSSIEVHAPAALHSPDTVTDPAQPDQNLENDHPAAATYEIQELNVELGQQVQAGQLLATLADHSSLLINGYAFKQEAAKLEAAAQNAWPIEVVFSEDDASDWPAIEQRFEIRHLSNTVDVESRTLNFFVPLQNQSRRYEKDGATYVVWRFRPGQRARLRVPVEQIENVFVVPLEAVVHEGPEAYVFQQNGDLFKRLSVHVIHESRSEAVIANDGSVAATRYLAQGSAASLNRALKAQAASGIDASVHVHADGTVHAAH